MPGEGTHGDLASCLTSPSSSIPRPETGDSERLLENDLGAQVGHHRHADEPEGEKGGEGAPTFLVGGSGGACHFLFLFSLLINAEEGEGTRTARRLTACFP